MKDRRSLPSMAHWGSTVFALAALAVPLHGCGFIEPAESDDVAVDKCSDDIGTVDTQGCPPGFVRIPPGTFTMGSSTSEVGHRFDEVQHAVTITRAFCMKVTEVTQGEWQAVMGDNPSRFQECGFDCPVEGLSWEEAVEYSNALSRLEGVPECYTGTTFTGLDCKGYRLPTEAEWEYAARAGTTGRTYGRLDSVAWYVDNNNQSTRPVGGKAANCFGLYDMLGNVWEWTGDWYGTYPGTVTDPTGPTMGSTRVIRGGGWCTYAYYAHAAFRSYNTSGQHCIVQGFRLAVSLP